MCDCFKDPSKPSEEITLEDIKKLPEMAFTNITGGEPFVRQDIPAIVEELYKKWEETLAENNDIEELRTEILEYLEYMQSEDFEDDMNSNLEEI